jgi:polygalacturonase
MMQERHRIGPGVATASAGNPSASQGGLITFDCDYSPNGDAVRLSPPAVRNINISNVTASNVTVGSNQPPFESEAKSCSKSPSTRASIIRSSA